MGLEALTRVTQQIKMNLQDSSQRNHETSQNLNEKRYKKVLYKCDKYQDTGWILIKKEHAQPLAVACECRKTEKLKDDWKSCGINTEMCKDYVVEIEKDMNNNYRLK